MNEENGILLWKAPEEPNPEPVARLSYKGVVYEIPYTLIHWISGWITMGQVGTAVLDIMAMKNTNAAFSNINAMMARDANPLSEKEKDFYHSHGIKTEIKLSEVLNYRNGETS